MSKRELHREVPRKRARGNRFWFRAAALSFGLKLALLVAIFFGVRAAF